ncbi:MAG: Holliday junction branch migration protein RuvA [Thermoflexales bacterium]
MIARLRGTPLVIKPPVAVVDVQGIGFKVTCSRAALDELEIGKPCDLHTHLIVGENELALYGFVDDDELSLFVLLISVQSVGPRTALALLSHMSPKAARAAIAEQRADVLAQVPGVGKKTAEKIIFALKGKMSVLMGDNLSAASQAQDAEVIAALTSLGFSLVEAQAALAALPRDESLDLEEKIRRALAYLGLK